MFRRYGLPIRVVFLRRREGGLPGSVVVSPREVLHEERVPFTAGGACQLSGLRLEKFGREDYSLRLRSTPAARSPSSAPKIGAGAWVKVGVAPDTVCSAVGFAVAAGVL